MPRFFYNLVLLLAIPLILLRLLWRGRLQRGYREHIGERFGRYPRERHDGVIWIHAVSVGETRAAQPLIKALRQRYPQRKILVTGMTPTGRDTARELFGAFADIVYLPYDLPFLQQRLIDHFRPAILLIMETEIWPNLIGTCKRNRVPALLVNARLSEKSRRAYLRWPLLRSLAKDAFASLDFVGAQADADAARLVDVGAMRVEITGNMKFDMAPDRALAELGASWRPRARQVLLAANTREGEEDLLLAAFMRCFDADARRRLLLVIVPRHPQRFDEVFAAVERAPLNVTRRSSGGKIEASTEVWLGDSMGEMSAYYAMADLAIVGGSFLPLGGHNLIEAAAQGVPVIMGPSTFNFADAARLAAEAGALKIAPDADEAMAIARSLLSDDTARRAMSDGARQFAAAHRGATEKTIGLIVSLAPLSSNE